MPGYATRNRGDPYRIFAAAGAVARLPHVLSDRGCAALVCVQLIPGAARFGDLHISMDTDLMTRRVVRAGALLLIGHGIMGLIKPRWRSLLWHFGPEIARAATEELADHPTTARCVYAAEAALGLFIAIRQTPDVA